MKLQDIDKKWILRAALKNITKREWLRLPLWSNVGSLCGVGSTSGAEICRECGWSPSQKTSEFIKSVN